jgi:hypothetical protein
MLKRRSSQLSAPSNSNHLISNGLGRTSEHGLLDEHRAAGSQETRSGLQCRHSAIALPTAALKSSTETHFRVRRPRPRHPGRVAPADH